MPISRRNFLRSIGAVCAPFLIRRDPTNSVEVQIVVSNQAEFLEQLQQRVRNQQNFVVGLVLDGLYARGVQ